MVDIGRQWLRNIPGVSPEGHIRIPYGASFVWRGCFSVVLKVKLYGRQTWTQRRRHVSSYQMFLSWSIDERDKVFFLRKTGLRLGGPTGSLLNHRDELHSGWAGYGWYRKGD